MEQIDIVFNNKEVKSIKESGMDFTNQDIRYFDCSKNNLISLEGCPNKISGSFSCHSNKELESLEGGPSQIGGFLYSCHLTNIKSLKGCPSKITFKEDTEQIMFVCSDNKELEDISDLPSCVTEINVSRCKKLKTFTTHINTTLRFILDKTDLILADRIKQWKYYEVINESNTSIKVKEKNMGKIVIDEI